MKEGTENSQGKPQLISNINACQAVVDAVRTTLGPRGMDKLIVGQNGKSTISNDGATIMKLLDIVHPAAKTLVDIAKSQDAEVKRKRKILTVELNFSNFVLVGSSLLLKDGICKINFHQNYAEKNQKKLQLDW